MNLEHIKLMFNKGYLTAKTAMFINRQGYSIVCRNGRVEQIIKVTDE